MVKRKKYAEYAGETQVFMGNVEKFLIAKFGEIQPQWEGLLNMLATEFQLYVDCKERINEDGLLVPNAKKVWEKHPLIKVQNDALIQITKLAQEFGLSPKSIKNLVTDNNDDEFIDSLTQ